MKKIKLINAIDGALVSRGILDLLVDCKNKRLIPNPNNPDYPVTLIL